jgi:hypothetical protein
MISKDVVKTLDELAEAVVGQAEILLSKIKNRTITEEEWPMVLALLGYDEEEEEW